MNPEVEVIEKYRIKKGLGCAEVARKLNRSPSWYSKFKKGKVSLQTKHIIPLSELFGITPERLTKEYISAHKLEETSSSS